MGAAKEKGLEVKGLDPVRVVAANADVNGEVVVNIIGITRLGMDAPGTVAHLAAGIFQRRGPGFGHKAPRFSIAGGMAFKASLVFCRGEFLLHLPDALKRTCFFREINMIFILISMAGFTGR